MIDVQKYNYETEKSHYHGKENSAEEKLYFSMVKDLDSLKLIKESAETLVLNAEKNIKSLSSEKIFAKGELNKVLKEVNLVERKVKKLDREQMSFANKIGDIVRDLPIIDFLSPYYKVEQVVLPDIKYNVNFASVPEVDRCTKI